MFKEIPLTEYLLCKNIHYICVVPENRISTHRHSYKL